MLKVFACQIQASIILNLIYFPRLICYKIYRMYLQCLIICNSIYSHWLIVLGFFSKLISQFMLIYNPGSVLLFMTYAPLHNIVQVRRCCIVSSVEIIYSIIDFYWHGVTLLFPIRHKLRLNVV